MRGRLMSRLELRHLATLVALRDAGSLVDAAERVNLTQSALSHQLKALEERLGTPLFERKSRPVRFYPRGGQALGGRGSGSCRSWRLRNEIWLVSPGRDGAPVHGAGLP